MLERFADGLGCFQQFGVEVADLFVVLNNALIVLARVDEVRCNQDQVINVGWHHEVGVVMRVELLKFILDVFEALEAAALFLWLAVDHRQLTDCGRGVEDVHDQGQSARHLEFCLLTPDHLLLELIGKYDVEMLVACEDFQTKQKWLDLSGLLEIRLQGSQIFDQM